MCSLAPVLLVAPDPDDALLFKLAFSEAAIGNPLRVAHDNDEAACYLHGEGKFGDRTAFPYPQLIIVSLSTPARPGLGLLQRVTTKNDPASQTPVVVLAPQALQADAQTALALGAAEAFVMPATYLEFVALLRSLKQRWLA